MYTNTSDHGIRRILPAMDTDWAPETTFSFQIVRQIDVRVVYANHAHATTFWSGLDWLDEYVETPEVPLREFGFAMIFLPRKTEVGILSLEYFMNYCRAALMC